jgi:hypothetical protein
MILLQPLMLSRRMDVLHVFLEGPLKRQLAEIALRAIPLRTALLTMIGIASCYWGITGREFTNRGPGSVPRGRSIPLWWGRLLFCTMGISCLYLAFRYR